LVVGKIAEKPVRIKEELNFDYTKPSPVALVPIGSCTGAPNFNKKWSSTRVIPANHKLELTVLLNLPESDYNRRLGVFQVYFVFD
jgi:seipin